MVRMYFGSLCSGLFSIVGLNRDIEELHCNSVRA